ncbi:Peptidoglycan-binding domain 1 protein [Catenulispora acidiphila DSM 44928]|uniref:Peptidoglycan-binding domain 1 protein n=1 Tax=Catenulispora acidiphila (strain DSM 44928 / JCM 14897 / NBRC 102108 / NRRL B-24433 / ID139908) TaxID=479433 RepID=C7QJC2_CATAD|nr:peptidoglycan-binding domain-containing protein [Catenulispora acidiphila]ACU69264.1 Peptidoglycan-binding domain 1 protein [Catenulispora acidiphila DSM 44928]
MTWELPAQGQAQEATQAIPAQNGSLNPDSLNPEVYASLFRPEGAPARANPNATQVMPSVPDDYGRPGYDQDGYPQAGYDQRAANQPAYDQPIDYQAAGGGAYAEPYETGYADDYPDEPSARPSNRGTKIGIGVAAGAVLVIVISLITLGGGSSKPSAGPANTPGTVTTPTVPPSTSAPQVAASDPATSTPSSPASSTSHAPGTLQLGDSGAEVKWLQTRLHQLGVYNGPINSKFDAATQAAVAAFQAKTHASDPAGVVGRSTKTALIAAGSKPTLMGQVPNLPGGPLGGDKHHRGNNPADVKRLQQALAVALNTNLKATGQFDLDTFGAVVQYQGAMHMTPDGLVNGTVWAALQQGRISG